MSSSGSGHRVRFGAGSLPAPKPGLIQVPVDGETVIYDPETDLLHHLDSTASTIWAHLDGAITLHVLAERIAAAYRAPETIVCHDVLDLVGMLWDRGLLRGSEASATATPVRTLGPPASGPLSAPGSELEGGQVLPNAPYRTRDYHALEHVFKVATNDAAIRDYLEDVLVDLPHSPVGEPDRYELLRLKAPDDRHLYLVRFNGRPVTAASWLDRAIAVLLSHINAEVVRRSTPRYPLVHAAAAVLRGVAVLLPAPAESGKTTTVAGLVRAGFGYLTDEAVAIDPDTLLAQPYSKALSVDRGSWQVLADLRPPHHDRMAGQWQLPARLIRPDAVADPAPVRFIITPNHDADSTTRLMPIPRAEMLMTLADSTFQFQDYAKRNLHVLARVVMNADCYRLSVGDLDRAVALIEALTSSEQLDVAEG